MKTSISTASIVAMAMASGASIEDDFNPNCASERINKKEYKNLPSPKMAKPKFKRNKKRGY